MKENVIISLADANYFELLNELIDQMKFDIKENTFVENYLPNHKIGIIHLAGKHNDVIRLNNDHLSEVRTLDGKIIKKSLRFKH